MTRPSIETEIHACIGRLTAAEARAARALLADYPSLGLAPVAEFARSAGASGATVLRFIGQIGFASYPDFQRRLREELSERSKSPLQRAPSAAVVGAAEDFLPSFAGQIAENMHETVQRLPTAEFEAVCALLTDARGQCHIAGGRFTGPIASYLAAHLRVVRSGVRRLEEAVSSRADQILDVKARDCVVIYDIRRYDGDLLLLAKAARARGAQVVLITDSWISPVSRHARLVLPCNVEVGRAWDSSAALFVLTEAIIARVTERGWETARARMTAKEGLGDPA